MAGTLLAAGCALTHHAQAPEIQELALRYPPPPPRAAPTVDAAIKVRRFSALSPYDGTTMEIERSGYRMDSFNYYRWATSPPKQVTDLLYRDLAATRAFRAVFPYLSTEQARFQLEGTVVELVMAERSSGSWEARLVLSVSLVDTQAQRSDQRVLFQRRFTAAQPLQDDTAEQYASGMSAAMKKASDAVLGAVGDACRTAAGTGEAGGPG